MTIQINFEILEFIKTEMADLEFKQIYGIY